MPALVAGIHVFASIQDVDGRDKPGHDIGDVQRGEKVRNYARFNATCTGGPDLMVWYTTQ